MSEYKIIELANGIQIGTRYFPFNSYLVNSTIVVPDNEDLIAITTLYNNKLIQTPWQNFEDSEGVTYDTKQDVIDALITNNT